MSASVCVWVLLCASLGVGFLVTLHVWCISFAVFLWHPRVTFFFRLSCVAFCVLRLLPPFCRICKGCAVGMDGAFIIGAQDRPMYIMGIFFLGLGSSKRKNEEEEEEEEKTGKEMY